VLLLHTGISLGLTHMDPRFVFKKFQTIIVALTYDLCTQLTYLAQCPGSTCTGVDATTLKWVSRWLKFAYIIFPLNCNFQLQFKIDEAGLLSGTVYAGSWGAGKMIAQNNSWTTTIPSTVPSGNYLIRFETIALHSLPAVSLLSTSQLFIASY
jgi:cellulase